MAYRSAASKNMLIWQKFGTKVAELILGGKGKFFVEEARVCDLRRNNNRFQLYIKYELKGVKNG